MQLNASLSSSKAKAGMCKLKHMEDMISCLGFTTHIGDRALDCIQLCPIIQFSVLSTKLHYSPSITNIASVPGNSSLCLASKKPVSQNQVLYTEQRPLTCTLLQLGDTVSAPHEPLVALLKWNRDCSVNNSKIRLLQLSNQC